jgi:hypothetical protein
MKNEICRNCKHWITPHDGMIEPGRFGTCRKIHGDGVEVICEGCVDISNRVDSAEVVTLAEFGCNRFLNNDQ